MHGNNPSGRPIKTRLTDRCATAGGRSSQRIFKNIFPYQIFFFMKQLMAISIEVACACLSREITFAEIGDSQTVIDNTLIAIKRKKKTTINKQTRTIVGSQHRHCCYCICWHYIVPSFVYVCIYIFYFLELKTKCYCRNTSTDWHTIRR